MDKTKAAVSDFLSRDGKHDTTVHESVNPAVQHEHITRPQTEESQKVVDREIHQDHHHTSVQPVTDREVLPEQHSHHMGAVETREFEHGDKSHVKERLAAEAAQFKDTREFGETQRTTTTAPTVAGEHVHHHVHETIQPVVEKETIQPSVVHTTIPVKERHHNEVKHHTASTLPSVSMSEFERQGGSLSGRGERSDAFAGAPRSIGDTLTHNKDQGILGGPGAAGTTSMTDRDGARGGTHGHGTGTGVGVTGGSGVMGGPMGTMDSHSHTIGTTDRATTGAVGMGTTTASTGMKTGHKPSLMDRLNPMKDTDGDGKKGIMD